ncbi:MAG: tRNA (cytidine(34)-2'-O)-methyltransferase [Phycisphaerales bacterium JB065]
MPTEADQPLVRSPHFRVVLHEPEIPNNTGNIGRTCVATGSSLHLVHPLGFDTDEKACRRAGLDYWPRLGVREHANWDACVDALAEELPPRLWLLSTRGGHCVWDAQFQRGDVLVFGRETRGLPEELLDRYPDRALRLPMMVGERSLNQASAVCTVLYEGLRQLASQGQIRLNSDLSIHP